MPEMSAAHPAPGPAGRLILARLRPWHRVLARCAAQRLDRELAAGASPEASTYLAARAAQLTSMTARRHLAASVRRILAAAGDPAPRQRAYRQASAENLGDLIATATGALTR